MDLCARPEQDEPHHFGAGRHHAAPRKRSAPLVLALYYAVRSEDRAAGERFQFHAAGRAGTGGNLYLSLSDAIALALENNIDIEVFRYQYPEANADLYRAKSGAQIRGVTTQLANGIIAPLTNAGVSGISNAATAGTTVGSLTGPLVSFDPVFFGTINWAHQTTPENNTVTTGTTSLISRNQTYNFGVTQGFMSGATATFSYDNTNTLQNSPRNSINPYTASYFDLTVTQPLLQGFGFAVNNRNIRIAKNNLKVTEYAFQQQVINTVSTVIQSYWNLVTYISSVDVAKQSLAQSTKLWEDNKTQVDIGTLAPISVVQAERRWPPTSNRW